MDKRIIIFFVTIFFIVGGCKINTKKIFKKEYYQSGKLKTSGWYIEDSIPVDTLYTFYESGSLSDVDIFDDSGYYLKAIGYYRNGNMNELINFTNGLAQGFWYNFYQDGTVKKKVFYLSDISVGDAYFFGNNNNITSYNFYDWHQHNINLLKYDSVGNIIKDIRQTIFIDSLKLYTDSLHKKNEPFYNLLLIISNPPKCKSIIKIDYVSKNNNLLKSDSVINEPYYFTKESLPDSLAFLNILGSQYDSIKNKTIFQKSKMILKYQE